MIFFFFFFRGIQFTHKHTGLMSLVGKRSESINSQVGTSIMTVFVMRVCTHKGASRFPDVNTGFSTLSMIFGQIS